jgi:zinc and cadmium transporter
MPEPLIALPLVQIIAATLAGGVLSVLAAAAVSFTALERWGPRLVAFAVGMLLATAFVELLPEAANTLELEQVLGTCLAGILAFFALEKIALWRHEHAGPSAEPRGGHKPAGMMILVGDGVHNFVDGVVLAAAFLADPVLGWTAAAGIVAHEIPQEVGDFAILRASGYSRARALACNVAVSLAAVAGGVVGYFALSQAEAVIPYALALSAASFIYIAAADLMPELNRRWNARASAAEVALMVAGAGALLLLHAH